MHELAIAESILSVVLSQAEANKAKKITRVNLKIGKMAVVVNDYLCYCFELISKDTIAKGAEVEIEEIPIKRRCFACEKEFEGEHLGLICSDCGAVGLELISGRELAVESIEIE